MYYSSGNYEAFARPKKPVGVDGKSAYIVGSGLAALAAACYLVGSDISVDDGGEAINEQGGVCLHVVFDPVEHQPDKGVFVDRRDEILILLADGHAGGLLVDNADERLTER